MAFNRSQRFLNSAGRTPPVVGPGTYEPSELFKKPRDPDGLYAFLSSATRNTLSVTKDAICFPGPGAYNIREFQKHITGGCSIDFTESRLNYCVREGPGPTSYRLPDDTLKQSPPKQRVHSGTWRGAPGLLYLGSPPRSIMANGVSVPTHRDVNGYDINELGVLVKNPPDDCKPSLFYDIPREETNFTTRRYKGNFWSRMTGRQDPKVPIAPGPGAYHLEKAEDFGKLQAEKLRESRRMTSRQPRYIEAIFIKNQLEGKPAPNAYNTAKSPFESEQVSCECQQYIFKPPPFGQGAKRFTNVVHDNPAPGTYDPTNRLCCTGSVISAPFGSLSTRFKCDNSTPIPGPGQYFSPKDGLAYESCKRCKRNYVKVGFNSSAKRNSGLPILDDPAPNSYPLKLNWGIPRTSVYHSAFKSTTKRFKPPKKDTVAPNAYDIIAAYNACHKSCEFLKCPEDAPFNSKKIRMPEVPDWVDMNVPGPGLTDTRGDIAENVKGGSIACGRRFRKPPTETGPGPQDYCDKWCGVPLDSSECQDRMLNVEDVDTAEISYHACTMRLQYCLALQYN